jgi:plasmid maintenance system antidote protein VapI
MLEQHDEAARLWVEIRRRDLAIYEVAGRIGTHPTKLGRVLRGREPLTPDIADRIRAVLTQEDEFLRRVVG